MAKKYSSYSDLDLVKLIEGKKKKDSENAFKEIYDRYSSSVHAYCMRVLSNEEAAEDIFQEVFIKFYRNVRSKVVKTNIPGFLITIARNMCLNHKRDTRQTVPIDNLEFLFPQNQNYEQKELLDLITRSLELVDDDYREAFVLREYSGLSYKEIAEISEISLANAKSRVFRAKKQIKEILKPYLKDLSFG
jgi:RNA polymerase sigma-70 factor (ECF subfamily)